MRIAILGPLLATDQHGAALPIGGARLRALLIRLALDAGRTVSTDALIDAVWGGAPPAGAPNALQALISRLRRILPPDAIAAEPAGYRVNTTTDVAEFQTLVREERFAEALARWRGEPLQDVSGAGFARAAIAHLTELRAGAVEEALAQAGPAGVDIAELEAFAAAHPLRERVHAQLIAALAAAGRQADAVAVYERVRRRLADELGLDPSPELAEAYAAMLRGEHTQARPSRRVQERPDVRPDRAPGDAAGNAAGNVRAALTSFVGRDAEVIKIVSLVRAHRLVTLVGPGGAGKTRLASEVGRRLAGVADDLPGGGPSDGAAPDGVVPVDDPLRGDFAGGVWMAELASVRNPDDVPRAVADALRLREIRLLDLGGADAGGDTERVLRALESRRMLLILDNCEHLIAATARFAAAVLDACPGVHVLSTSREPMAITGETLRPVGPLMTPAAGATPEQAGAVAAARLFRDRAGAVRPGFAITETNVDAVVEICRRLDGMPLAIELACARLRTLPVETIAARLDDRFRLLTGGSRTAMARHQTLLAVVEWSWDLLSDAERTLAAAMSVFWNGATNETLTAVFGDVDAALAGLVDRSLVTLERDGRYQMLETIRAYAADRLAESGDADGVRGAVARHLAGQVEIVERDMRGPRQAASLAWITAERENINAAMRWAIDVGDASVAVRVAGAMGWFWLISDAHAEAAGWLAEAMALPGAGVIDDDARALALAHYGVNLMIVRGEPVVPDPLGQAKALRSRHPVTSLGALMAAMFHDDMDQVRAELPALLAHEDPWVRAIGLAMSALVDMFAGEPNVAERKLVSALDQFRGIGDQWAIATMTSALGEVRALRGDHDGARAMLVKATELASGLGITDVETRAFISLGMMLARSGDLVGAREALDRARAAIGNGSGSPHTATVLECGYAELARREGNLAFAREQYRRVVAGMAPLNGMARELRALALYGLAFAELGLGDVAGAEKTARQVHDMTQTGPDRMVVSLAAVAFAAIAIGQGDAARAAYLLGVGDGLRGVRDRGDPDARAIRDQARQALGDAAFDEAYQRGSVLSPAEAGAVLADGAAPRSDD